MELTLLQKDLHLRMIQNLEEVLELSQELLILLNVNEESTQLSIEEALKDEIFKKGGLNIYRVILQGKRKPELFLIPEKLKSFGNITEVLDETRPAYDLEELQKKYAGTLIGDYICFFMEKNRNTVEDKALYYGLQALLETRHSS